MWIILISLPVWAANKSYTDVNSIEAERAMKGIVSVPYTALTTEADQVEWVKARIAWIALERLRGREAKALEIFEGCENFCEKHAADKEWSSLKAWGCSKKKEAKICLPNSTISTKAQKPPH